MSDDPTPTRPAAREPTARGRHRPSRADRRRPPGHDPGARPDRAARPRQGAWRAARRRRRARRPARPAHAEPGRCREWTSRPRILVTNDDGVESRGLLALKQALEPMGDVTVVAPDTNQSAVGHQKTLMRPLRVRERTLGRRLAGLLGRRLADRRGQPRVPRLLRARLRPRRVGHQLRREPRRRHHVFGHGQRRDGGGHQQLPGVRDLAGVLRAPRFHARRLRGRRSSRGTSSRRGYRAASSSTSTCPAVTIEECEGIEVTRLGRRVYSDELIERLDPRGIPYFWIGGPPPSGLAVPGTDFHAVVNRRIAVTPIHLDLTGRRLLRRLKTWQWDLEPGKIGSGKRRTRGRDEADDRS